jgi:C4-dicarboxylate transporter DctM subunit
VIIPPSIPMILFGVSAEVSIGELFIAGFGAGPADRRCADAVRAPVLPLEGLGPDRRRRPPAAWARATVKATWALLMPVIILGGIYGGIFTPTEASVVAVFYALIGRPVRAPRADLGRPGAGVQASVVSSAVIMFIIANAGLFAFLITRAGVPDAIGGWLSEVLHVAVLVPAGGERGAVRDRHVHRDQRGHHRAGADPGAGGAALRHRPGALRHDHGRQPGAGHDHAALRRQPVRRLHRGQDLAGPIVGHLLPFVGVIIGCLMLITYVPSISLTLRDIVYPPAVVAPAPGPAPSIGPK